MSIQLAAMAVSTGLKVFGMMEKGREAQRQAELQAFNIETDRELGRAQATERSNDRQWAAAQAREANIAAFSATGRDIGSDRSVDVFLKRQKEIVGKDLKNVAMMSLLEGNKATMAAMGARVEGRAQKRAATIGALTTIASGVADYEAVRTA